MPSDINLETIGISINNNIAETMDKPFLHKLSKNSSNTNEKDNTIAKETFEDSEIKPNNIKVAITNETEPDKRKLEIQCNFCTLCKMKQVRR